MKEKMKKNYWRSVSVVLVAGLLATTFLIAGCGTKHEGKDEKMESKKTERVAVAEQKETTKLATQGELSEEEAKKLEGENANDPQFQEELKEGEERLKSYTLIDGTLKDIKDTVLVIEKTDKTITEVKIDKETVYQDLGTESNPIQEFKEGSKNSLEIGMLVHALTPPNEEIVETVAYMKQ